MIYSNTVILFCHNTSWQKIPISPSPSCDDQSCFAIVTQSLLCNPDIACIWKSIQCLEINNQEHHIKIKVNQTLLKLQYSLIEQSEDKLITARKHTIHNICWKTNKAVVMLGLFNFIVQLISIFMHYLWTMPLHQIWSTCIQLKVTQTHILQVTGIVMVCRIYVGDTSWTHNTVGLTSFTWL